MATKKKIRLKEQYIKILEVIGVIITIILGLFLFYRSNINDLKKIGYSEKASKNILIKFKKKEVLQLGKNKTLNKAFESSDYNEKNFTIYPKIKYQNQKHLIKNINTLIKKGYSNDQISMILSHGDDNDVTEFAKRKKVRYLEEFYSLDYAKLKYYDRYLEYMDNSREDEETTVLLVNLDMDKEEYKDPTIVKEFSYTMLVNKHRELTENFTPKDLVKITEPYTTQENIKANRTAYVAAKKMIDDAEKEGYYLTINSAYRSYKDQEEITKTYQQLYGDAYVEKYVLKPGFSEHQTGLGLDIGSKKTSVFANSTEYNWIKDNCYKYGFIYRFKPKFEDITGIRHEAWHYRYVGKKAAKYIYDNNISLEEYYVRFVEKN